MARYIIGFDLGHGQCSVAKLLIAGNGNTEDLCIKRDRKLINSHLLQGVEGKWILDPTDRQINEAIQNLQQINAEGALTFEDSIKEPIPLGDEKAADRDKICNRIKTFLKQLFKTFDENNQPGIITDPEYELYFACPSAWTDEEREAYETVINEALCDYQQSTGEHHPKTVKVIRESDAAYIASRKNWREYKLPDNPHVLIIDFGSSTIDFTWYGDSDLVHDGDKKDAGASKVEKIFFYYLLQNESIASKLFDTITSKNKIGENNAKKLIITQLRKEKERFFSEFPNDGFYGADLRTLVGNLGNTTFGPEDFNGYSVEKINEILSCNEDYLTVDNETFDGRNYMGQVKEAFEEFKKSDKMQGRTIDAVVITGGASRMPFVEEIAREVFGTQIIKDLDHDCNFVVSRGTAIWGRYHYLASPKIEQINKKLAEDWGIISDNALMCEGNNDDVFSIDISQNIIDNWKVELHTITKDIYKYYLKSILSSWTNDDAYSYNMGHNLKDVLEALPERPNNLSWQNLFKDLTKDENILDGRRSIHSLLRNIYDCIDGNPKLLSEINATLKTKLKESVDSNILPLLDEYYKVYFGQEAELPEKFLVPITNANVDAGISISFTDGEKEELLTKLIGTTMDHINEGVFDVFSSNSFNKDRINPDWGSPGVHKIKNYLEQPLEEFASNVEPSFNDKSIEKMLKDYAKSITRVFLNIKKECQGSLYTPNSTVSQNLFGENGTTNPTNAE